MKLKKSLEKKRRTVCYLSSGINFNGLLATVKLDPEFEHYRARIRFRIQGVNSMNTYCMIGQKLLHRIVANAPSGTVVDHINGNGLDNRFENLRICTSGQNSCNQFARGRLNKTSKYKGVSWSTAKKKWAVFINYKNQAHYVGRFDNEEEAARAYDARAREIHGEFARTNFSG